MKAKRILGFPILFTFFVLSTISFQSCEPDERKEDLVYKPNIYIYPEEEIQLDVILSFPMGGKVITSIPEYINGWSVTVDKNGIIDDIYSYLFYESLQPDIWQKSDGWLIKKSELESFFRMNMAEFGFFGQEIDDFIDYWIPRLNDHSFYAIYPQTKELIDDVIEIYFSTQPKNSLRLFYVIKGHESIVDELPVPEIESFNREGFYVTEWGVIL